MRFLIFNDENDTIKSLLSILKDAFFEIFGNQAFGEKDCKIVNDPNHGYPEFSNTIPLVIYLSPAGLTYWSQVIYQLSHELCHFVFYNKKSAKNLILSWFEEIVCEAFSLYCLKYMARNWLSCDLSKESPRYCGCIKNYLENELQKSGTDVFKSIQTAEEIKQYEYSGTAESDRDSHRNERNKLNFKMIEKPEDIKVLADYTKYIATDGVRIDFYKWFRETGFSIVEFMKNIVHF